MNKCKFTIITVCFNAEEYIRDTIKSVLTQSYKDFEYIIKDGQSLDRTGEIVHELTDGDHRVSVIESSDRGIYDAMNIALPDVKGEYILFLNAGDKFAEENVLEKVDEYIADHNADIFYGNVVEIEDKENNLCHLRVYTEKNSKLWYYSLGACLCHQAMFCKKKLFEEKLFDLNYQVCADREWQMYHISNGAEAKALGFTVAEVLADGFSMQHVSKLESETNSCVRMYCGQWYILYRIVCWLKRNKLFLGVIQTVEKIVSCK